MKQGIGAFYMPTLHKQQQQTYYHQKLWMISNLQEQYRAPVYIADESAKPKKLQSECCPY